MMQFPRNGDPQKEKKENENEIIKSIQPGAKNGWQMYIESNKS